VIGQLFAAAPQSKGLTLGAAINQPAFDALLAHGAQLIRLTCLRLDLSEDRSQSACSWKELVVTSDYRVWQMLAILPLHSLSHLAVSARVQPFAIPSARPHLELWLSNSDTKTCTTEVYQAALTNLGTCPAWQDSGPSVRMRMSSIRQQRTEQHMPFVSALAALANTEVQLEVDSAGLQLQVAGDIIQHLGATLGHRLTHLTLVGCTILHGFWPAVWRYLPGLQELSLWSNVAGVVGSRDIAAFCSHATRPLSLRLTTCLYSSVGPAEQLEQQCRTWGVPQVTLSELNAW
jgi:hypothetical protein